MTTTAFGKVFGVFHAAVIKWENGQLPALPTDIYIRMYVMDRLNAKNADFGKLFMKLIWQVYQKQKRTKEKKNFR